MSVYRELFKAVRTAMKDWSTTLRLCCLLLVAAIAMAVFLVVLSLASQILAA